MCNVLHEILPEEWLKLFGPEGCITSFLKPTGGLLIVEDYQIPAGELAHRYGFLLLNTPELKKLFNWNEADITSKNVIEETSSETRYKDRLVMHWVGQPLLKNVDVTTRRAAISQLRKTSAETVTNQQKMSDANGRDGHLYALAAQTYANASIWLDANPA